MERSVLLIVAFLFMVTNGHPFYSHNHGSLYNGFDNIFQDMFSPHQVQNQRRPGYNHDLEDMPNNMDSIDNQFASRMTPVLIPIRNLGYPNQGLQYNPNMNQAPYYDNGSPVFADTEAPFTGKSSRVLTEEDNSPPLHLSTTIKTITTTPPQPTTTITTTTPSTTTASTTTTIIPNVISSELPTTTEIQSSSIEDTDSSLDSNNNQNTEETPSVPTKKREADLPQNNDDDKLEKESLKINKQTSSDPSRIVFPDNVDRFKQNSQDNEKYPNRFSDASEILYAVNIAPSLATQYSDSNTPRPNTVLSQSLGTQGVPLTNMPSYTQNQNSNQPTYVWQNPGQTQPNNIAGTIQNTIALPNQNGGTTLYSVVNLPTSGNTYVPNQMYQPSNVNTGNYQTLPMNGGMGSGSPAYYLVSQPNQNVPTQQNTQTNVPFNYSPVTYTVGYVSSDGQTVLVPSNSRVYQVGPQNNYAPVSNSQGNVETLAAAPSNTITLPENTDTITLLSYKDKVEEKPKKKKSEQDDVDKLEE